VPELPQDARPGSDLDRNHHPDAGPAKDREMVETDEGRRNEGGAHAKTTGSCTQAEAPCGGPQGCRDKEEEPESQHGVARYARKLAPVNANVR